MKNIYLITVSLCIACLMGCDNTPASKFGRMKSPIILVAESKLGAVTLCDSEGTYLTIPMEYYLSMTISDTYEPGDTLQFLKGEK